MAELLATVIGVLRDWRVIAIAVGTIVVWAVLRRVGSVYQRPKPARRAAKAPKAVKAPPPKRGGPPTEEGEEMVE